MIIQRYLSGDSTALCCNDVANLKESSRVFKPKVHYDFSSC